MSHNIPGSRKCQDGQQQDNEGTLSDLFQALQFTVREGSWEGSDLIWTRLSSPKNETDIGLNPNRRTKDPQTVTSFIRFYWDASFFFLPTIQYEVPSSAALQSHCRADINTTHTEPLSPDLKCDSTQKERWLKKHFVTAHTDMLPKGVHYPLYTPAQLLLALMEDTHMHQGDIRTFPLLSAFWVMPA